MKNALLLPLRYLLNLLLCVALAFLCVFCHQLSRGLSMAYSFGFSLTSLSQYFPFLSLLALFFVSFIPSRRPGNLPLSYLFLFILSFSLIYPAVIGLDSLKLGKGMKEAKLTRAVKLSMVVRPAETGAWFIHGLEEGSSEAQGIVRADFSSAKPILSYQERGALPPEAEELGPTLPRQISSILQDAAALSRLARSPLPTPLGLPAWAARLIICLLLAFFFTGLWVFPRISSYPLFGALLLILAFRAALLLCAAFTSTEFGRLAGSYLNPALAAWLPYLGLGILGLSLLLLDIFMNLAKSRSSGRSA